MDLVTPLKAYVDAHYAGRDAEDAAEDLREIAALRADVVANALASPDARRDLLLRCAARGAEPRAAAARRASAAGCSVVRRARRAALRPSARSTARGHAPRATLGTS